MRGRATLGLLAFAAVLACRSSGAAGEFEDELGDDEGSPPDLLQPECDPREDEDCPAGQKCSYVVDPELGPTNRCVELLGDKLAGESCELLGESDDCGLHTICWATDPDGTNGICVEYCNVALQCALETQTCSVSAGGLLPLCLPSCDPLAQDCAEGWGCYADPNQRWACDRDVSGASGAHGQPCDCINCCDPGLVCISGPLVEAEDCMAGGAAGCCAAICDLEQEPMCPGEGEDCEAFYEPGALIEGFEQVGLCRL